MGLSKYYPPLNFSLVEEGVYRSGHPIPMNYAFLATLGLKTVIYIGDKTDNDEYYNWMADMGIKMVYVPLVNDFKDVESVETAHKLNLILNIVLNSANAPILIHSNKGKHRVGVVVGLIRRVLQGWSLMGVYDEYFKFTQEKGDYDLEFIELFHPQLSANRGSLPLFCTSSSSSSSSATVVAS